MKKPCLSHFRAMALSGLLLSSFSLPAGEPQKYEVGGPAAGFVLPVSPQNTGSGPEVELFPGSVEHWRGYMMKYVPMRSFFDQQSLLKRWIAADLPGIPKARIIDYASPVYAQPKNGEATDTGKKLPPVKVVRSSVDDPVFALDLGELGEGLYAIRVIGAVDKEKLRRFREPLYLRMTINDGLQGEKNTYRIRCAYVDEFYNLGTFYFHALEKRKFQAEVAVDRGSKVDLLVHDISLDDVLAGTTREALKTRRSLTLKPEQPAEEQPVAAEPVNPRLLALPPLTPEERLARDEALWNYLPPLNTTADHPVGTPVEPATRGIADKTMEQIEAEYGVWAPAFNDWQLGFPRDPAAQNAFLVNTKLGLTYTMDDLRAHKPLPDPYPIKDDGAGLYFPDAANLATGRVFSVIAPWIGRRYRDASSGYKAWVQMWKDTKNDDFARDAAVSLVRYALQFPTIEAGNYLGSVTCIGQWQGRDYACRMREAYPFWMPNYAETLHAVRQYDELFDYIQGNEELAKSINRFVPWVKTSQDVIKLLDTYLVQTTAKRILRYHYVSVPTAITDVAIALGDKTVTQPWMDWQFSRTWTYPLRPAGLRDTMIVSSDREGAQYVGSTYYAQNEGAARMVESVQHYVDMGGDPKFSLIEPVANPKPLAHAEWQINNIVVGADFPRIGDVTGPDKTPGFTFGKDLEDKSRFGWKITGDPRFAWPLVHIFGQDDESPAEWQKIVDAAAKLPRAPWLDLHSRHVDNWAGILESGHIHDDYRYRRAATVRTGVGQGHGHADALDLQVFAHGLPMTIDGGQRSGYSKPNDGFSRIHNLVEVDGGTGSSEYGLSSYGWVKSLFETPGLAYLRANVAKLPPKTSVYERQVALVDVDEGSGSKPLPPAQQRPRVKLDPAGKTANSYVVDFFRVGGGSLQTYCFHGPLSDDFQWNAAGVAPVATVKATLKSVANDADYLSIFDAAPESQQAGNSPDTFTATWQYVRSGTATNDIGSEKTMLGVNFDPASPRKFTRLTLLGAKDLRALKADVVCGKFNYRFTNTMLQKRGEKLDSVFTAIIEPYVGEPFIRTSKLLPIANNDPDALRAAAVEVETVNGHHDVTFTDGRPEKVREISPGLHIAGEFAFYSTDADGLRLASLVGGTQLESPDLKIGLPAREFIASIVAVDYPGKSFTTDQPLPASCAGEVAEFLSDPSKTSFTIAAIAGTKVTLTRSAEFYRSNYTSVKPAENRVDGVLDLPPGRTAAGLTLSNDDATKLWRVKSSDANDFTLDGAPAEADFEPAKAIRLWEYGIGTTLRLPARASLTRTAAGTYELRANSPVTLTLKGAKLEISPDGKSWKPANAKVAEGWVTASLPAPAAGKSTFVRVAK